MLGGNANATATATGGNGGTGAPGFVGNTGAANANSFAMTINGNLAQAQSNAAGSSGQAQATAQTNFGSLSSVQTVATNQVGGTTPASALAQVGGDFSNAINPGQSFSAVSAFVAGPLTLAVGSMGAGYGGTGQSLTYHQSASFMFNAGGPFLINLFDSTSLGSGFDSATFEIRLNGNIFDSRFFNDLFSARTFFSNNLIALQLLAGLNEIQLSFSETMSSAGGFSFDYAVAGVIATPLPPAWTIMLIGLAGLGLIAYRGAKNGCATIAAA
jgi:hypothetical protein